MGEMAAPGGMEHRARSLGFCLHGRYDLIWASWAECAGRWALGAIFLFAAVPKILDPAGFASDIANYQLLPEVLVPFVAVTLPWIEAFTALALVSGFMADGAALLVTLQLVFFIGALAQAWFRDLDIDCGCFGHGKGGRSVAKALVEDWVFLALAVSVLWYRLRSQSWGPEKSK